MPPAPRRQRSAPAIATAIVAAAVGLGAVCYVRCREDSPSTAVPTQATGPRSRLADLRHQPPGSIAGTVLAADRPVASATVCARSSVEDAQPPHCSTTDARGEWRLADLAPSSYVIWASAAGIGGAHWRGPPPEHDTSVTVGAGEHRTGITIALLVGAVEIHGVVRDVRGVVVAAADVQVGRDGHSPPVFSTQSRADGTFDAWALPGEIYLAASAVNYVDGDAATVAPDDHVEIVMTPAGALAGIVVDASTHRPIDDAEVVATGYTTRTDASGRFRLTKLPPGRYKPTATSIGGYGETAHSALVGLGKTVEDLVIEIHPVAVVAGRIAIDQRTGERPCPADQGQVWLSRYGSAATYRGRTLSDGVVLLEGVVPGTYEVNVSCERWLGQVPYPDLVVAASDVDDVTWHVSPGARIAGRVRAQTGPPIGGAVINVVAANGVVFTSAMSAADGTFVADGLSPGTTTLTAYADGFVRGHAPVAVVAALATVATAEIVLDRGGAISGVVYGETGLPTSAFVEARGPDTQTDRADRNGRFRIEALAPGTYTVSATTDEGASPGRGVTATVTSGATSEVRLTVATLAGVISGDVVDVDGAPITDAYVVVAREDDPPASPSPARAWSSVPVLTGMDGGFRLDALPRGMFSVRAYRSGAGEAVVEHVATGDHARITIHPTGILGGVVVSANGSPVDDVTVTAEDRALGITREERLYRIGGRFEIRDLPAGSYRLSVDDDPGSVVTVAIRDQERRADLRLIAQPRYSIHGRLVSHDRTPLAGWKIEVPRLDRSEIRADNRSLIVTTTEVAITDANGRFWIHNLPLGPTTISAGDVSRDPDAILPVIREIAVQGPTAIVDVGDVVMP